jgi:hypothetical protein
MISPFPFPLRGKPGRVGSPHAEGTSRASKKRWHLPCDRLPPQEGPSPPCASPWAGLEERTGALHQARVANRPA